MIFMNDEEIKKLLEQNLEMTKEIYALTKKIKGYVNFQKIMSLVYLLLIVVPIILSIIYLPPLIKDLMSQYQGLLGLEAGATNPIQSLLKGSVGGLDLNSLDLESLPPEVRKMIK